METKRVAIGDLEGAALDWGVAKAVSQEIWIASGNRPEHTIRVQGGSSKCFHPSGDWSQCGPLMDRFDLSINVVIGSPRIEAVSRIAETGVGMSDDRKVAACRAIVASHNPDGYVDVPVELLP